MGNEKDNSKKDNPSKGQFVVDGTKNIPENKALVGPSYVEALSILGVDIPEKELFIHSRVKKVAAAIHLITDTMPFGEPLRLMLREESMGALSRIPIDSPWFSSTKSILIGLGSSLYNLVSFLEIAVSGKLLSYSNFSIIKDECDYIISLMSRLEEGGPNQGEFSFPSEFFAGRDEYSQDKFKSRNDQLNSTTTSKRNEPTKIGVARPKYPHPVSVKDIKDIKDTKSETLSFNKRKESIIRIVRKDGEVTVKDLAKIIAGCSEKTIQRELLSLVDEGILKKTGEKRWSRYSLAG